MIGLRSASDPVDTMSNALEKSCLGQARDGAPTYSGILGLAQREQAPLALRDVTDTLKRSHTAKYVTSVILCSLPLVWRCELGRGCHTSQYRQLGISPTVVEPAGSVAQGVGFRADGSPQQRWVCFYANPRLLD